MDDSAIMPPIIPHKRISALQFYAIGLTVIVLGVLGWYIWYNNSALTCPRPKTIQYSYDDPRDYLGPFLRAMASDNSRVYRSYYLPHIAAADKQTLVDALTTFRSTPLTIDGWDKNKPWSDTSHSAAEKQFTRLTWTTKKVDGCWRVQRVDTEVITNR